MSVPSAGWNVARCCGQPLRSSAQPWGIEKSRASLSLSDLACLDTDNRIVRQIGTAVSQLQVVSKMHNVNKMTFDFCVFENDENAQRF